MTAKTDSRRAQGASGAGEGKTVKFELYGEEIVEKQVAASGGSGRVYLPVDWLGKRVKIIRVD